MHSHAPEAVTDAEAPTLPDLERYEASLWEDRESLTAIYESALARKCSPWAVFAACAALALTTIPPTVKLPGQGSLNWFASLVAPSGFGKGEAVKCAKELMPQTTTEIRGTPSSGEGIRDLFLPDELGIRRQAVLINEAEVDTVDRTGGRTGSTVLPTLRKAWEGALIDFITRGMSKPENVVPEHSYRLCLLCGVQPGRGRALMTDAAGTAQRFMWFPAVDWRATGEAKRKYRNVNHRLTLPKADAWRYYDNPNNHIILPTGNGDDLENEIDDAHDAKLNILRRGGELDPLDTHEMLLRLKTAVALMVLDGRDQMNEEDWWLSYVVMGVSKVTRRWVVASLEYETARKAAEKGREYAVQYSATADTRADMDDAQHAKTCAWLTCKLTAAGSMNYRELNRSAPSAKHRRCLRDAINALYGAGVVRFEDKDNDPLGHGARWFLAGAEQ